MTNGYIVLTKGDSKLYQHALEAINLGKPIYFVDAENKTIYFSNKIAVEDADVVIDAGKYTVRIESDNDVLVTASMDISIIEDSNGYKRFIEGDGTSGTLEGLTVTYAKWSLSGTHLMLVFAGSLANNTQVTAVGLYMRCFLPTWILNKINPVWENNIEVKNVPAYASDWTIQNITFRLSKESDAVILVNTNSSAIEITADRNFRVQFDLMIDSE